MRPWEHSVRRPVATTMLVLAVILLGVVALTNLRLELLPRLNAPVVAVITSYPGASAREVSSLVTEPIEAAAATTPGVTNCRSISQEGVSVVILEFAWGTDMAEARSSVAERLDQVNLPEGARRPFLVKFDPTLLPVMSLTVATEGDLGKTTAFAREVLKPRLESIDGVAAVEVFGSSDPEIHVDLDPEALRRYGLTQDQIARVIGASNLDWPLGSVREEGRELGVRLSGRLGRLEDLRDLVVGYYPAPPTAGGPGTASGAATGRATSAVAGLVARGRPTAARPVAVPRPIRLADVAKVERGFAPASSISRTGGSPSVELSIQKEGDANTVQVARRLREELDAIRNDYPGVKIFVAMDQARIIEMFLGALRENLLMGGALAVAVLFLFLRHLASTFAIAVAIPFSVVAAFVLLHFSGLTLNIMTLGGLALGVGMLVDNAIVVIESIFRHLEQGEDPRRAAITGTSEVAMAITASTLTTLAVFLPVVFVGGITGHLFRELALTVTFALAASLVVAVTLVPAMAAHLFRPRRRGRRARREGIYARTLRWCLGHRAVVVAAVLLCLGGAAYLTPRIGTEFLPVTDEGAFTIDIAMPPGTDLETTSRKAGEVERILDGFPEVDLYTTTVGTGEGFGVVARGVTGGTARAQILVNLVPENERQATTAEVMERVRQRVEEIRGPAQVTFNLQSFASSASGMAWNSIQVYVRSLDPGLLPEAARRVMTALRDVAGLTNLESNLEEAVPELDVSVDRGKALARGLTPAQVAMAVSDAVKGQIVTRLELGSESLPVRVRQDFGHFPTPGDVESVALLAPSGQVVRLGEVASLSEARGPVSVTRHGQLPSVLISALVEGRDLGSVTADVRKALDGLDLPRGVAVEIGGASAMMEEGFSGLNLALALSVALVYMVMATQFESLLHPLVIMFTIPLAFVGVVALLYVTGTSLGITAYIGGIILAGIVVNNGIVMVDYINQLRHRGLEAREAIVRGASVRLRPVLMTALTTLLGLFPLALGWGEGGELNAPLARAVVGGLTTSTILTLVVIPVVYSLLAVSRRWQPAPELASGPEPSEAAMAPVPAAAPSPAARAAAAPSPAAAAPAGATPEVPTPAGTACAAAPSPAGGAAVPSGTVPGTATSPGVVSVPHSASAPARAAERPGEEVTMEEFSQLLEILGKLFLLVGRRGNRPDRPAV